MSAKLILLCKEGDAREAYLKEAKAIGVEVDVVSTYSELFKTTITNPYQGVMIDLPTSMRASKDEKGIVQEILEVFPIVQVKWDAATNVIRTMSLGKSISCDTLNEFINKECQEFPARAIRLNTRKIINFNTLISKEETMYDKHIERTVTINCSRGGAFFFSAQDWKDLNTVWFIINELQDKSPIVGKIRWAIAWGKALKIPGIGISFKHINPNQMEELTEKYQV